MTIMLELMGLQTHLFSLVREQATLSLERMSGFLSSAHSSTHRLETEIAQYHKEDPRTKRLSETLDYLGSEIVRA